MRIFHLFSAIFIEIRGPHCFKFHFVVVVVVVVVVGRSLDWLGLFSEFFLILLLYQLGNMPAHLFIYLALYTWGGATLKLSYSGTTTHRGALFFEPLSIGWNFSQISFLLSFHINY